MLPNALGYPGGMPAVWGAGAAPCAETDFRVRLQQEEGGRGEDAPGVFEGAREHALARDRYCFSSSQEPNTFLSRYCATRRLLTRAAPCEFPAVVRWHFRWERHKPSFVIAHRTPQHEHRVNVDPLGARLHI
jgi:hypothetical protein